MDFFNSLSQIAKNKDNFKKWEDNQKDEQAKREELYKRRQHTDAEIAKAKALGENIIDVVDIMDNHSESVAENVETATEPIVAFAPIAAFLGTLGIHAKFVMKPNYKKIHDIENKLKDDKEVQELVERIKEYNKTTGKNKWFDYYDLTNKNAVSKIKNSELRAEAMKIFKKFEKDTAKYTKANKFGWIGVGIATLASFIGVNIYAAKLQVDSSKIARYQARESLKDPKAFVTYTPEQIAKAKEEIAKHPELKNKKHKEKLKTGMIKSIINLFKDRKAYLKSVKNDTDDSKKVTRDLTADEIKRAKEDQEVIQRTVRIINNEAEKYSQNMEVAAEVLINGTPFLGAAIGGAIGWMMNKFGVIEKFVDKKVNQNASEETKQLYAELKKGKESGKTVHFKWGKFHRAYMEDIRNGKEKAVEEGGKVAKRKPKDFIKSAKSLITTALAHPIGKKWIIAGVGSVITSIAGLLIGLKLQKSSARAGRYTAKRELEKDPRNFIGYTDEDYEEVKDVKSDKKGISKVKETIMFLPTVIKQYYAYEKYKKHEYKEKQILQKELQKQDVSEKQLRDAKNLQRKVFNTFEKVDDNSQTYSESTEAAIDIAQPFVMYGGLLAMASPLIYLGIQIKRGKISAAKVLNKLASFFSKSSEKMKSKWFKKYLNNVAKNVSTKVQNTNVDNKPLGTLLKGVNFKEDAISAILNKTFDNLKGTVGDFRKLSDEQQIRLLCNLSWQIENSFSSINPKRARQVGKIINSLQSCTNNPQTRADVLDIILNPSSIKAMGKERYDKAYEGLKYFLESVKTSKIGYGKWEEHEKLITKMYKDIQTTIKELPTAKLREAVAQLDNIPELKGILKKSELEDLIKHIEKIQNAKPTKSDIREAMDNLYSYENVTAVLEAINKIQTKLKTIPDFVDKNPNIKAILKQFSQFEIRASEQTEQLLGLCKQIGMKVPENGNISIDAAIALIKSSKEIKFKNLYDALPTQFKEPKSVLNYIEAQVKNMSDDEFLVYAERFNFSSMDRKTALEIIPKLQKVFDNIPKEEAQKIWDAIVTEMQTHPDEFLKLVRTGKIGSIFITPGLKKALTIAGISWTAFTLAITYVVESWLADMQLKAGRLGVMKAIESLDDPRYYANIEPTEEVQHRQTQQSKQKDDTNLLKRINQ